MGKDTKAKQSFPLQEELKKIVYYLKLYKEKEMLSQQSVSEVFKILLLDLVKKQYHCYPKFARKRMTDLP